MTLFQGLEGGPSRRDKPRWKAL